MASRRARLKAVANLPVRRKPGLSQDTAESAKITPEDKIVQQADVGIEKIQQSNEGLSSKSENNGSVSDAIPPVISDVQNKDPGEASDAPKETDTISSDCKELKKITNDSKEPENVSNKPELPNRISDEFKEPGNISSEIKKPENIVNELKKPDESVAGEKKDAKKDEKKPIGPSKFNRRIKPVVNLPVRKERAQPSDSERNVTSKTESPEETQKLNDIPDNVNNNKLSSLSESNNVLQNVNFDSNVQKPPVNSYNNSNDKVITQPEQPVAKLPLSPVKTTQRPVFLRPNIDLSNRRPTDEPKTLTLSHRVRNISESSNSSVIVHNVNSVPNDSNSNTIGKAISSALRRKKPKSNDLSRKMADARREFHRRYEKIKPDRSSLRMIDLIFYNPTTNPMNSKSKPDNKEGQLEEQILAEEKVDDPEALDSSKTDEDLEDENLTRMPVPQVKIGLNGEIILDEKSLVIETTDAKRGREDLQNSVPVFEDRGTKVSYYCRKNKKAKDWTDSETKRFYKALNTIGTDFLLMKQFFPNRDRLELKKKFKREEKLNRNLIDKALNNPSEFDMTQLEKDLEEEKRLAEEEMELKLQKKAKPKTTESRGRAKPVLLREMVESDGEMNEPETDDPSDETFNRKNSETQTDQEKLKKLKEVDMLYEKFILKNGLEGEQPPATSDQNENLTNSDDFNKLDFKRKISEENNLEALDLTVNKKAPLKKPGRKRKGEKLEKKRKKRKKDEMIYKPDVEEPETDIKKEDNLVVTQTITDRDFFQLLAANVSNMKESNVKVQVTEDPTPGGKGPGKKIEIIFDEVPPITLNELKDQPVTVLADCNRTICEDESPKSPEESENHHPVSNETSVIVENPNASKKIPETDETYEEIENENVMLVIDESDQAEYQYMMVEQEVEPLEVEIPSAEDAGENVDVENVDGEKITGSGPNLNSPSLVVCKNPQTDTEKMYLAGLSAGSFVLVASDAIEKTNEKKLSMYMISEKSQSDGSSRLAPMPVMLPPELLSSLTHELDCS